jgi:hypothetical protein
MTTYTALLNGTECTAKKVNGVWTVGGDYDTSGSVQLVMERGGRPAWFTLRGCVLKFSDYLEADEIAQYAAPK